MAEHLEARGDRSVVVGRDVFASIINTGDHNKFFIGDYEHLRDAFIEPWPIFERVDLEHFTGREWLLAGVDDFLQKNDRGYLVLEAEAGLGKTTFLAWLTRTRGYVHHFFELKPGLRNLNDSLRNLAAQLVLAYHLDPYEAEGVLPGAAARPDFLLRLLKLAADQCSGEEKVVIVIDALDEAGNPEGQNVLGLPAILPEGVFLIVSQRPVPVALHVDLASTPRGVLSLTAEGPSNLHDMRRFLAEAVTRRGVTSALHQGDSTAEQLASAAEQLASALLERSRGVWIYLHYILHEIESGDSSPLNLDALPDGLTLYYIHYWQRWRDRDSSSWADAYLPLLTLLAATPEAVTAERLLAWGCLGMPLPTLRRLLNEQWRPFLAVSGEGNGAHYRFHHASLREFFGGRGGTEELTSSERSYLEELAGATRAAHGRLADRYLNGWGSLDGGLPGLRDEACREMDDGYGLRNLAAHLKEAGRDEELHRLLRLEWIEDPPAGPGAVRGPGRPTNTWYAAHDKAGDLSGYFSNLTEASRLTEEAYLRSAEPGTIGLSCRYALIRASLNSMAGGVSPAMLEALTSNREWSIPQALAQARQTPDPSQRAAALLRLVPSLPERERGTIVTQALAAARGMERDTALSRVLVTLAPHADEAQLREALELADRPLEDSDRAAARAALIPRLPRHLLRKVLTGPTKRFKEVIWAARQGFVAEAHEAAISMQDHYYRGKALLAVLPRLAEPEHSEALKVALAATMELSSTPRIEVLSELLPHLSGPSREPALQEALAAARATGLRTLVELTSSLAGTERERAMGEVLAEVRAAGGRHLTEQLLGLPGPDRVQALGEAVLTVRAVTDPGERAEGLAEIAPHLVLPERDAVASEALETVRTVTNEPQCARVLTALAPSLSAPLLAQSLTAARALANEAIRADVLTQLAPHLTKSEQEDALREAVAAVQSLPQVVRARATESLLPRLFEMRQPVLALKLAEAAGELRAWGEGVGRILPDLLDVEQEALLQSALMLNPEDRDEVLARLAKSLPEPLLWEAFLATHTRLGPLLRKVLPPISRLPGPLLRAVLRTFRVLGYCRIDRKSPFASRLAELGSSPGGTKLARALLDITPWGDAKAVALRVREGLPQDRALAVVALRGPRPKEAADLSLKIKDRRMREETLFTLLPRLPATERQRVLREALSAAVALYNQAERTEALAGLAACITRDGYTAETVSAVLSMKNTGDREKVLLGLLPHLPEPERRTALREAVVLARAVDDGDEQAFTRSLLAIDLGPAHREEALREAFAAVRVTKDQYHRAQRLAALGPHLPPSLLANALEAALSFDERYRADEYRAQVLAALAPQLTGTLLARAVHAATKLGSHQAQALGPLGARLAELGKLPQALEAAREVLGAHREKRLEWFFSRWIPDPFRFLASDDPIREEQLLALARLLPYFHGSEREWLLEQAFAIGRLIKEEVYKFDSLIAFAPHLSGRLLREGVVAALMLREPAYRAMALGAFLPHLTGPELTPDQRNSILERALKSARDAVSEGTNPTFLATLAAHLPEPERDRVREEALRRALGLDEERKAQALLGLSFHLPEPLLREATAGARRMYSPEFRAVALAALLPALATHVAEEERGAILAETLALACSIEWGEDRRKALSRLASDLTEAPPADLPVLWREAMHRLADRPRPALLADLRAMLPFLRAFGGEEALAETFQAIHDVGRWWP